MSLHSKRRSPARVPVVLWVLLALVAAACGGDDGGGTAGGGEPGGGEIGVGMIVAFTGSGSFYGDVMTNGARLAAEEVNSEGGVEDYTFEIVPEDHESGNADVAVAAARKLLGIEGVPVILSSFTAPTVAVRPLAVEQGVLVLNGGGIGSELIGKEGLYNTRMLGAQLMPGLVRWMAEETDADRVATIFWNDAAGRAINDVVSEACGEVGCSVVAAEPHEIGETNFSAQLARIKAANPQLVVLGSYGTDVGHIVSQARRLGIDAPIIGNEWTPDAQEVGGRAMEGYVAVIDQFNAEQTDDPEAEAFVEAYQEAYGEPPEFYGANYYELVRFVLPELVRISVENDNDPAQPGTLLEAMRQAVEEGHEFDTLYGETMAFNEDGTVQKPAAVYRVEDGALTPIAGLQDGEVVET